MEEFEWSNFYQAFARKLLEYRDDREALVEKINAAFDGIDINMPTLEKDKKLVDIDPFTTMGLFNKGQRPENRIKIATALAKEIGLEVDAPETFGGIPVLNNQNATFYRFVDERKDGDIDALWDLLEAALRYADDPTERNLKALTSQLNIANAMKGNGMGKLTMALYWIAPNTYLNLDGRNVWYLYESELLPKDMTALLPDAKSVYDPLSYAGFLSAIEAMLAQPDSPHQSLQELSAAAWRESQRVNNENKAAKDSSASTEEAAFGGPDEMPSPTLNTILYGPPGTGKTYETVRLAVRICDPGFFEDNAESYKSLFDRYEELCASTLCPQIAFTTFHQAFCYEDFVEGIKPVVEHGEEGSYLAYQIQDGMFKRICGFASQKPKENFVLIVDEINRGNISNIFGELITLLEPNKRLGASEERRATLPYSKNTFGIPSNLYVIGTMNTADRSLTQIDTALRRRFDFIEVAPNSLIINPRFIDSDAGPIDLREILNAINARIAALYDRDHLIGHSYLMGVSSLEELKSRFSNKIIPLLQEYFYDDFDKIGQVLNDMRDDEGLIIRAQGESKYLANLGDVEAPLVVRSPDTWTANDFIQIYLDASEEQIANA